jgi:transposase
MQKREMSTKEQIRETVLKELINREINGTDAAKKLKVSIRQVKRLKQLYLQKGSDRLIHQSRGKPGSRKIDEAIEQKVIEIIKRKYSDFGPLLVSEKLHDIHGIQLGRETIRQMMIKTGIWKAKPKGKPEYHCWRERRSGYGELQQFDGSYHDWFERRNPNVPEACLLASIDDATGKITHAVFAPNEGVIAVFQFWWEYILMHGIPVAIYLDKFSTYKINHKSAVDNHELITQFQRVAQEFDLKLISAHSPQAKGRIERLFQTLQDRLVKELRLHNISTTDEANIFLKDIFIPWFNSRFAVEPRSTADMHRVLHDRIKRQLSSIFSQQSQRSIHNDFTIRFKNNFYQLKEVQPVYKSDHVTMEERLDGTVHIRCKGEYLSAFVLPEQPKKQKTQPLILTTHRLNWKPTVDHPWRQFVTN